MARNLELEKYVGSSTKDSSLGLLRLISFLIVFVVGVVIGLTSCSHVNRYFNLHAEQFYNKYAAAPTPSESSNKCTIVLNCEKEDCYSMDSFIRPKNLTHEMSDEELFWRASMVPKKAEFPYHRVPKVAFMFLTRGPLPLSPLWERFFKGHEKLFSIYVHTVPGYVLDVSSSSPFYGRQIPSRRVDWGSVSLVDAEKRLLANALLDFSNERFVLLSESCIPVYNFPIVYEYLIGSSHSYVQSYDDPSRYGRGRYSRWMYPVIKLKDWRKGSQWFEMNRTVAILTLSDTKYYKLFKNYCHPSCYPDEHYIPTFLHKLYGPLNSNRSVTWVDWSLGGPHPANFSRGNITVDLIQDIRNNGSLCSYNTGNIPVCFLFARKFNPSALEPLFELAYSVMKF